MGSESQYEDMSHLRRAPGDVVMARPLSGGGVLPERGGWLVWEGEERYKHAMVLGASGMGKTETMMQLAFEAALSDPEMQIFMLDAKGSERAAERFVGLMKEAGRTPKVFPHEPFNVWKGGWRAIMDRMLQVVPFAEAGDGAFYREVAKRALQMVCKEKGGPPRSSEELLNRMEVVVLAAEEASGSFSRFKPKHLAESFERFATFFESVEDWFDGDWSWENVDAGYFLVSSAGQRDLASSIARVLYADFAHYFTLRKPLDRPCGLWIDEFSAIARNGDVATAVEQAREFKTSLVLAPQTLSGMGSREQADRIIGSTDLFIVHGSREPQRIAALSGEEKVPELTRSFGRDGTEGEYTVRMVDAPLLTPEEIQSLEPGEVFFLRRGRATKAKMKCAPRISKAFDRSVGLESDLPGDSNAGDPKTPDTYDVLDKDVLGEQRGSE